MEQFAGRWKQVKQENFEDYLKASGVNLLLRKVASTSNPSIEFKKNDDGSWTFYFYSTVKNGKFRFQLGEETEEITPDGRKFKSTITVENGKLIHKQKAYTSGTKDSYIERWVDGEKLYTTAECDGVLSKYEDVRA
ncbi:unnamed protein product [Auanema sp. JU1783]|nr:unnamed protein product [Auanema sp. JU1783]